MFKHWHFSAFDFQELRYRLKIKASWMCLMAVVFIYLSNNVLYENHILQPSNYSHIFGVCMAA